GGDGWAPSLKRTGATWDRASLYAPAFSQTAKPENVDALHHAMEQLVGLLDRCGVHIEKARIHRYPVRRASSSYPASRDGVPSTEVRLTLCHGLSFVERVGFRYCVDKSFRSSAAAVYWRMIEGIHAQRLWMSEQLQSRRRERPAVS